MKLPKSPKRDKEIIDDIRAGLLSIQQIADKHGVGYHRVYRLSKKLGDIGDLRGEVITKAQDEVVALRIADNINDAVVVEQNAKLVLTLLREHSDQVSRARNLSTLLMDDLESAIRNRAELEEAIIDKCANDKTRDRERMLMRAVSLSANTKTLSDLAGAMKTLIGLEREMFNIGKGDGGDKRQSLEDYVMSLPGESTAVPE